MRASSISAGKGQSLAFNSRTGVWLKNLTAPSETALAFRLPAEVLYDAVLKVTGAAPNFPGVKAGTRAAQLPDSTVDVPSGFLANLGRPPRESACECERSNDIRLGSVMTLLSGPAVSGAVNDPRNEIARVVRDARIPTE